MNARVYSATYLHGADASARRQIVKNGKSVGYPAGRSSRRCAAAAMVVETTTASVTVAAQA